MAEIGRKARAAARPLAVASAERKHAALIAMAEAVRRQEGEILAANATISQGRRKRADRRCCSTG